MIVNAVQRDCNSNSKISHPMAFLWETMNVCEKKIGGSKNVWRFALMIDNHPV